MEGYAARSLLQLEATGTTFSNGTSSAVPSQRGFEFGTSSTWAYNDLRSHCCQKALPYCLHPQASTQPRPTGNPCTPGFRPGPQSGVFRLCPCLTCRFAVALRSAEVQRGRWLRPCQQQCPSTVHLQVDALRNRCTQVSELPFFAAAVAVVLVMALGSCCLVTCCNCVRLGASVFFGGYVEPPRQEHRERRPPPGVGPLWPVRRCVRSRWELRCGQARALAALPCPACTRA